MHRQIILACGMLVMHTALAQTEMGLAPIGAAPPFVASGPQRLLLQTFVNGNPIPGLLSYVQQGPGLWADTDTLQQIGLRDAHTTTRLDTLPGVTVVYDAARQQVSITAALDRLDLPATVVDAGAPASIQASPGTGLLLNYDLYGVQDPGHASAVNAASELRAFTPQGVLANTMITSAGHRADSLSNDSASHVSNVRLDTAWSSYWPEHAVRLTVGDTTTSSLSWSRSLRMGGIQIGRDYSLQPYRSTMPLPAFMGSAAVPSAVDLYINGFRRYQGNVPAGPFQLDNMPTVTGLGDARMVLTDALGRQTQVSIPFYASDRLLAPGLVDWGVEAGFVRRRYGYASFAYASEPAYSATLRYGASRHITLEGHAEATRGARLLGVGATASVGLLGQLSGALSTSQAQGRQGQQFSLGYQWQSRRFHVALNTLRADESYRDLAAVQDGQLPARVSESAVAGINLERFGSINASYVSARYAMPRVGAAYGDTQVSRYAGLFWSKTLGAHATVNISYNRSLSGPKDSAVLLGLSIYLDRNLNLGATLERRNGHTTVGASASQWTQEATGWNWSLQGLGGAQARSGNAEASYRGRYGDVRAGMNAIDGHKWAYGGASGAVVLMNGGAFAGRRIDDGFAIVSTSGVPGVPVRLHNQPVGKTDARGMLMIAPLGAYQKNHISIDPLDLPANLQIGDVEADVAPQRQSGAQVTFTLEPLRAATIVLHDPAGRPLPVGARVRINGRQAATAVGYDGMAYLEHLKQENQVQVELKPTDSSIAGPDTTSPQHDGPTFCSTRFNYTAQARGAPTIGPLTCK